MIKTLLIVLSLTLVPFSDMKILRVIDGDTIKITAPFLPEPFKKTLSLRIDGIDTPEKGHRAKCAKERLLADQARRYATQLIDESKNPVVYIKGWGKFGGRVIGDIRLDVDFLSKKMIDKGLAVRYNGGTKVKDWCK